MGRPPLRVVTVDTDMALGLGRLCLFDGGGYLRKLHHCSRSVRVGCRSTLQARDLAFPALLLTPAYSQESYFPGL